MTNTDKRVLARRYFKAFEANDRVALKDLLAPDLVAHRLGHAEPMDRDAFLQTISAFRKAFSDQRFTIEDQIVGNGKIATRTVWRATHSGDYQGHPPTGKEVEVGGVTIEEIRDNRIARLWVIKDHMGLMQQVGLVPPPR